MALYLQNVPQFVIGLLATWKAGGIVVPVNPMNRAGSWTPSCATPAPACWSACRACTVTWPPPSSGTPTSATVVTTSELEYRARDDQRVFAGVEPVACEGADDMTGLIDRFRGQEPPPVTLSPDHTAFLTYTSGTTGRRKAR